MKEKLRILLTCDPEIPVPPGQYGGIERIVDTLVQGLVARGHKVFLCAHGASKVPCELIAWHGRRSQHLPDTIKNTATLTRSVLKKKVDIIHSFSRLAYMGLVMPFSIPKIMSYQREPSVAQVSKAARLSFRNSLRFTGCSNYIADQIKPHAKAVTIYNAAPVNKYRLNPVVGPDAPLVFLGRIEDIKGVHEAIVIAQEANRNLVIAGNIPKGKEPYFNEKVRPYLDEKISYIGPVDDLQKNVFLGNAAALLMPIQWNEPFGIVMAEAMACGTPVIGLSKGALPEIISHGITGFVCSEIKEMISCIGKLDSLDRRAVRTAAEHRFSDKVMVEHYLDLYRQMISN